MLDTTVVKNLIFDLDDTLFDTFGQLVAPAAAEACVAMIEAGMAASLDQALEARHRILSLNRRVNVYRALLDHFGVKTGGYSPSQIENIGFLKFHDRPVIENIFPFGDTIGTLLTLSEKYKLSLGTLGVPRTQKTKTEKLCIQDYFSEIFYVDIQVTTSKAAAFSKIMENTQTTATENLCIGNRIDSEIKEAKELGMQTILMKHGEYLTMAPSIETEIPDSSIEKLSELLTLLRPQGLFL